MTDKFKPPAEELPPLQELKDEFAVVTDEDVEAFAEEWRDRFDGDEYQNVLDAVDSERDKEGE